MFAFILLVQAAGAAEGFDGRVFYLGDLHVHTGVSYDGGSVDLDPELTDCGALGDIGSLARSNGLDFIALTDHINGGVTASDDDYRKMVQTAQDANEPEAGFVALVGGEVFVDIGGKAAGHRSLILFEDNETLSELTLSDVRFDGRKRDLDDCDALWAYAAGIESNWGRTLLFPHHPGMDSEMGTDWACHTSSEAMWYSPTVEIYSEHGNSAGTDDPYDPLWAGTDRAKTVQFALSPGGYGIRMGFVGGTDRHDTNPGGVCALDSEHTNHPYGGGLTVAVLDEGERFDRGAIYDAIMDRRTYATSGPLVPVVAEYWSDGVLLGEMGEELDLPDDQGIDVLVRFPDYLEPYVMGVSLNSPDDLVAMETAGLGEYRLSLAADDVPEWVYPLLMIDGAEWYGPAGCGDGGSDDTERIWLSPTWFDRVASSAATVPGVTPGVDVDPAAERVDPTSTLLPSSTPARRAVACSAGRSMGPGALWFAPLVLLRRRRRG